MADPTSFDPAAFVADLRAAGCTVHPGSGNNYFIGPSKGYSAVMAKWADALNNTDDDVEQVVDYLATEEKLDA